MSPPLHTARHTVAAQRAALARNPQGWQAALAYKAALAGTGRHAESDPVFQAARRRFPDAAWLAHMAALYAFPQAELPALIARAKALAQATPGNPALWRLLGAMRMQARDYAGAAQAFAQDPDAPGPMRDAQRFAALVPTAREAQAHGPAPFIAAINLDRNTDRWAALRAQFGACRPPLFRVAGVEGSRLPPPAIARLGADPAMPGTLGCFLGHAAAWAAMLARGLDHCLIVEDDVIPLFDLPARWGVFGLPESFDLCFVNDRMAPPGTGGFAAVPLADAMRAFPHTRNAPGADGYLLSAAGARTLLDWVAADGFGGDVDWRLLAYGLTAAQCAALPAASHARLALARLRPPGSAARLHAYALSPPLIRTVPLASDREDENRGAASLPITPADP